MTYQQAGHAARRDGFRIDVRCADGSYDLGQPAITAPLNRWIVAALEHDRIVLARVRR